MNVFACEAGYATSAVLYKMEQEGDKVVQTCQARDAENLGSKADVIVGRWEGNVTPKPYMSFECTEVPRVIVEAMGVRLVQGKPDWFVTKRRNLGNWHEQTLIGVPLRTMMNQDLGIDMWSGCATRFVKETSYADWFKEPLVETFFGKYSGFVSYGMNEQGLTNVWFGVPYWGVFNVLESVKEKVSDYIKADSQLLESWSVSLAVSTYGYPEKKSIEAYHIGGVNPELEKHFWPFHPKLIRKGLYTTSTIAGVVTAYHGYLNNAVSRAERTCWNLGVPNKQFRTDAFGHSSKVWKRLGLS